jgi:hypothetical protein
MISRPVPALLLVVACNGPVLDLGSRDAGRPEGSPPDAIAPPPSCPFIATDPEYQTLRGATCEGACSQALAPSRDLSPPDLMAAALTGKWIFCTGRLGPPAATGIQFFPGCAFFFLDGAATLPESYTYDVVTTTDGAATGVILHLAGSDVYAAVTASSCLGRARLTTDAGDVDMASLEPPDAAVAK